MIQINNIQDDGAATKVEMILIKKLETNENIQNDNHPKTQSERNIAYKLNRDQQLNSIKFQIAVKHFQQNSYCKINEKSENVKYSLFQPNQTFKFYNLNLYFYLEFLKYIIKLLTLLSLFSGARMFIHYYNSNGFIQAHKYTQTIILSLQKLTVANFSNPTIFNFLISSLIQLIIMIISVGYMIKYKLLSKQIIEKSKELWVYPKQYSVIIKGNIQILKKQNILIEQRINQCIEVKNYQNAIKYYKERQYLERQPNQNDNQIDQLQSKLNKQIQRIEESQIIFTIVHFKLQKFKLQFLKMYDFKSKLFEKQSIYVQTDIPNPHDINWLNISSKFSFFKLIICFLVILAVIVLSSFLINLANTYFIETSPNCAQYTSPILEGYVNSNINDTNLIYCYCLQNFPTFNDLCIKKTLYTRDILFFTIFSTVGSLICSITNMAILIVIKNILNILKLMNDELNRKMFFWIGFIALLLNTIIIPTFITLNIGNLKPTQIFTSLLNINSSKSSYSDFSRDWYIYYSPFYLNVILIGIGNPLLMLGAIILKNMYIRYDAKKNQHLINQKQLNESFLFFEFDIEMNAVINLVYYFVIIIFSVMEPIFMILGMVLILAHYISHKFSILQYSKKIRFSDELINNYTIQILPFAIWIQSFISICVYTNQQIFSSTSIYDYINLFSALFTNTQAQRLFQIFYFFVSFVFIGFYFAFNLFKFQCNKIVKNNENYDEIQEVTYREKVLLCSQFMQRANLLESYEIEQNPEYKQFFIYVDKIRDNLKQKVKEIIKVQQFSLQ